MSSHAADIEKSLLSQIAEGNERAFRQLYDLYWAKLYNYLIRIIKSPEITEEIVIDIFLKLWTGRELLHNIQHLDGFLRKVAYNKAMDFFKIASRDEQLKRIVAREMEAEETCGADHRLLDGESRDILQQAILQLSPQRRLIFTLSREKGLTHEQIARQLNLSRNTVRNSMAEALKSIRHYLKSNDIEPLIALGVFFSS
ncbi:RNA polymerase sigma factor [Chitinophaga alhagiae]|uniref:RNA polymerase sigma factor n=1 Tax=Chitinophaga alhagiae TaxID=2203219 RepID=UPI0013002CB8|nr:RNA polymerase sigma-70 factor [Chitinophaga alhagiae]